MPFLVIADEVSLLRKVGEFHDSDGKVIGFEHESNIRLRDEIVEDEDVSPVVMEAYDRGEAHVRSLIVRCDAKGKPVDKAPKPEPVEEQEPIVSKSGEGDVQIKDTGVPVTEVPSKTAAKRS